MRGIVMSPTRPCSACRALNTSRMTLSAQRKNERRRKIGHSKFGAEISQVFPAKTQNLAGDPSTAPPYFIEFGERPLGVKLLYKGRGSLTVQRAEVAESRCNPRARQYRDGFIRGNGGRLDHDNAADGLRAQGQLQPLPQGVEGHRAEP